MGRLMTLKEWRKYRNMAGILVSLVVKAGNTREAWRIYDAWLARKISFEEAKKRLKRLIRERRGNY